MTRKSFAGAAAGTALSSGIGPSDLTFTVDNATGYPSSPNPFVISLGLGSATEEKVLIQSRAGNTFTVAGGGRGYDGSTASSHPTGETVSHVLDAGTVDEVNAHVNDPTRDDHTQYLNAARHDITARHQFGAALGTPGTPAAVGTTASPGAGTVPARSDHVHALATGAINAAGMFAAGVVGAAALAVDSVGSNQIAADAVGSSEIAANAVGASEIAAGVVSLAKLGSGLQPVQVCTSGTRPGSPTVGMTIFETDTGKLLEYQSATTGWTPPWNTAWGELDGAEVTTNQNSIGTSNTDLAGLTKTLTVVANRKIRVTGEVMFSSDSGAITVVLVIAKDATPVINRNSTMPVTNYFATVPATFRDTPAAGSHTYKLAARASLSTVTMQANATAPATLMIEDMGPNGAPA